jgi:hypothetical protein
MRKLIVCAEMYQFDLYMYECECESVGKYPMSENHLQLLKGANMDLA